MLQVDLDALRTGVIMLESSVKSCESLAQTIFESAQKLKKCDITGQDEDLDYLFSRADDLLSLVSALRRMVYAAQLAQNQFNLAHKMVNFQFENVFMMPKANLCLHEITLTHLKNELRQIKFSGEKVSNGE